MPLYNPESAGGAALTEAYGEFVPGDHALLAWAYDPLIARDNSALTLGQISVVRMPIPFNITITNLVWYVNTAGATLTTGQTLAGLYSSAGTLLAQTATQHTAWASTGIKTMALTAESGQSLTRTGGADEWLYAAFLAVGTTAPAGRVAAIATDLFNIGQAATAYRTGQTAGSKTSLETPLPALSQGNRIVWCGLS